MWITLSFIVLLFFDFLLMQRGSRAPARVTPSGRLLHHGVHARSRVVLVGTVASIALVSLAISIRSATLQA